MLGLQEARALHLLVEGDWLFLTKLRRLSGPRSDRTRADTLVNQMKRYRLRDKKTGQWRYYAEQIAQGVLETDDREMAQCLVDEGQDYCHDDEIVDMLAEAQEENAALREYLLLITQQYAAYREAVGGTLAGVARRYKDAVKRVYG